MVDLKIPREKKAEQVFSLYQQMKAEQPGFADNRYFTAIAKKMGMTVMGVRGIVRRHLN